MKNDGIFSICFGIFFYLKMLIYISTPPPRTFGISLSSFIQPGTKPQKNFQYLFSERLCHSMWLFHLHSTVKIQPFYPNLGLRYFADHSFGTLRKKHQPFSRTQPSEKGAIYWMKVPSYRSLKRQQKHTRGAYHQKRQGREGRSAGYSL